MGRRLTALLAAALAVTAIGCGDTDRFDEGEALYSQYCQQCHGIASTGNGRLESVPVHGPTGHTWHHADGQIIGIVLGDLDYPGTTMPPFRGVLTEEEVRDVLAYIKSTWSAEQRSSQSEVSRNWERLQR